MKYVEAKSEVFSVVSAAIESSDLASIDMRWPGVSKPGTPAPTNDFYARAFFTIVRDSQASLARNQGQSRYEALAQLLVIVYSPISVAGALERGNILAEAIRDAYRKPSPSGLLSFTNQQVREVGNNDTHYATNVIVSCTYDNIQ